MTLSQMISQAKINVDNSGYVVKCGAVMVKAEKFWRGPRNYCRVKCYINGNVVKQADAERFMAGA
jgi:hypothetical protein